MRLKCKCYLDTQTSWNGKSVSPSEDGGVGGGWVVETITVRIKMPNAWPSEPISCPTMLFRGRWRDLLPLTNGPSMWPATAAFDTPRDASLPQWSVVAGGKTYGMKQEASLNLYNRSKTVFWLAFGSSLMAGIMQYYVVILQDYSAYYLSLNWTE